MKKHHIDFMIYNDSHRKIKFRFYPKYSHVHGFRDDCPTSWDGVYKVYYSWKILESYDNEPFRCIFDMSFDECSAFTEIGKFLEYIIKDKKKFYKFASIGQPGSVWELKYRKSYNWDESTELKRKREPDKDFIEFSIWNNLSHQGYRFWLYIDEVKKFIEFVDEVNFHMLENSEPI